MGDWDREQNEAPITQEKMVIDLLQHRDTHKSMGLDEIHPRVLNEMEKKLAKTLFYY